MYTAVKAVNPFVRVMMKLLYLLKRVMRMSSTTAARSMGTER